MASKKRFVKACKHAGKTFIKPSWVAGHGTFRAVFEGLLLLGKWFARGTFQAFWELSPKEKFAVFVGLVILAAILCQL